MRSLQPIIRLHKWQLEEKRRELGTLNGLRAELTKQAADLELEMRREQTNASQSAEVGWTYAGYALGVIRRRFNIQRSIKEIDERIEVTRGEVAAAHRELRKYEIAEEHARARAAAEEARREQSDLDEIALTQDRLRKQELAFDEKRRGTRR